MLKVPAVFMRGGTSKGVFFHARNLPAERAQRDRVMLRVLGSPDPYGRQLDGMGGGISSVSKVMIVEPSADSSVDVCYTFGQIPINGTRVDYAGNCGNLSSAVGPFAYEERLIHGPETGDCTVRLYNTNTGKQVHARFQVRNGQVVEEGSLEIAGVAGTGSPIILDFIDPAGSCAPCLLPTGSPIDELPLPEGAKVTVSLVDATNPLVFARARDFGTDGTEPPEVLEAQRDLMDRLEIVRHVAGQRMQLPAAMLGPNVPKIALVAAPQTFTALDGRGYGTGEFDVAVRMVSMGRIHRAITLTGAMCLGAAACVRGSIPDEIRRSEGTLRVGHPSGITTVGASVNGHGNTWTVASTRVYRTARRLMEGRVVLPRP